MSSYKPVGLLAKLTRPYWKRQCMTIVDQIAAGVRYFDIRICYRKPALFTKMQYYCHGKHRLHRRGIILEENPNFVNDMNFLSDCGCIVSLTLEHGDEQDREHFREMHWERLFGNIASLYVREKDGSLTAICKAKEAPTIIDRTYHPRWWERIFTRKHLAKRQQKPTDNERNDEKNVYLYDYI